jgi:hypothetical protein
MEIAILILASSLFIFLFYMFSRALQTTTKSFSAIQDTLAEMNGKLDKIKAILIKIYRLFSKRAATHLTISGSKTPSNTQLRCCGPPRSVLW